MGEWVIDVCWVIWRSVGAVGDGGAFGFSLENEMLVADDGVGIGVRDV